MLSFADALAVSSRLVALSVALQTLELLWLRRMFTAHGPLARAGARGILPLLALQLALCLISLALDAPSLLLLVLGSYLLVIRALEAPFNGGSDVLTCLSLSCLGGAALVGDGLIARGALAYLAVQTVLSYFIAGVAKLKEAGWRRGSALIHFACLPKYGVPAWAHALLARPGMALGASWAILLFECSFPVVLVDPWIASGYLAVGALFHAGNALLFGLNRFLFAWLAVYPVLLALSAWVAALRD